VPSEWSAPCCWGGSAQATHHVEGGGRPVKLLGQLLLGGPPAARRRPNTHTRRGFRRRRMRWAGRVPRVKHSGFGQVMASGGVRPGPGISAAPKGGRAAGASGRLRPRTSPHTDDLISRSVNRVKRPLLGQQAGHTGTGSAACSRRAAPWQGATNNKRPGGAGHRYSGGGSGGRVR
jgi:hypothetical protein